MPREHQAYDNGWKADLQLECTVEVNKYDNV
jgi:hypothetical protein